MTLSRILAVAALTASMTQSAYAFTVDDHSMNTPSAASNFSDPDEKTPGPVITFQGGSSQFSGTGNAQGQDSTLAPSARMPMFMPFPNHQ